jgi:hypothetical protein
MGMTVRRKSAPRVNSKFNRGVDPATKKAQDELKRMQRDLEVQKRTMLEQQSTSGRRRRQGVSLLSSARPTPEMGLDDTLGATSRLGGK